MLIWCLCTIPVLYAFSETHGWVCFVPPSWSVSPLYFTIRMAWPFTCITVEDIRFVFEKMAYIIKKKTASIECAAVSRPSWNTWFEGVLWEHKYSSIFNTCTCLEDIFGNFRRTTLPVSIRPWFLFYLMYILVCPSLGKQLNWRFRKRTFIFLCTTFYKEYGFSPSGSSCRFWSNVLSCTAYIVCLYIYTHWYNNVLRPLMLYVHAMLMSFQ